MYLHGKRPTYPTAGNIEITNSTGTIEHDSDSQQKLSWNYSYTQRGKLSVCKNVISVTKGKDLEIQGNSNLAISRYEEETNSNEDVDEADGAADCEADIQPGTAIEGDEHATETFLSIRKCSLSLFLTLVEFEVGIHL